MNDKNSKLSQRINDIVSDINRVSYLNAMNSKAQVEINGESLNEQ